MKTWTFLTNHGQVLLAIANRPDSTERVIALQVGITERAVQRIIADLQEAGYLSRQREGRRNRYSLHPDLPMRHQLARGVPVGELLRVLTAVDTSRPVPDAGEAASADAAQAAPAARPGAPEQPTTREEAGTPA